MKSRIHSCTILIRFITDSALITFGAPRTGNREYARLHDAMIPPYRKLRFVYNRDPAPHVPPMSFGFVHASREIWIEPHTRRKFMGWKKWGWIKRPYWKKITGNAFEFLGSFGVFD